MVQDFRRFRRIYQSHTRPTTDSHLFTLPTGCVMLYYLMRIGPCIILIFE